MVRNSSTSEEIASAYIEYHGIRELTDKHAEMENISYFKSVPGCRCPWLVALDP